LMVVKGDVAVGLKGFHNLQVRMSSCGKSISHHEVFLVSGDALQRRYQQIPKLVLLKQLGVR